MLVELKVSNVEYDHMKKIADFNGKTISELILDAIREHIEFWEDMKDIEEYEKEKASGNLVTYTMQEVKERLGL